MTAEVVRPARDSAEAATLMRVPAFWIVLGILAAGTLRMSQIAGRFFTAYPLATATSVALFALLAVPFWFFVTELDFLEREPTALLVLAFAWGGLVATAVSIPGSSALEDLVAKLGSPHLAADWGAALTGPTVEEIAKTLGVVAIVLIARAQINSVLDGIVYGAMVGLGFQIVEDVVFSLAAVSLAGQGDRVQPVVATFLVRGFLSGIWSHTLFGALGGAGLGYLVVHRDRSRAHRIGVALLAVFGAWASHVLWNSPIFSDGLGNGLLGLLAVLLLKGLPPLVLVLLIVRRVHDKEADYYVGRLAALGDADLITDDELAVLGSGARRAAARRHARARAGRPAQDAVRRLQRAQAHLAVELSRESVSTDHPCADIRRERAVLVGLGHPEAVTGPRSWQHTASTAITTVVAIAVLFVALSALGGG
ncbi:PrsW family intramembrane metalloprotease [Actinoplanes sp. NPDC051343]|uniref:PrsW family intramembrane metalloprotease n=1 Tax=Actinoplanes sp. NPDC051343 TaxID=3363906 RepID=UPI0037A4BCAC